jgi:hypothetical protein
LWKLKKAEVYADDGIVYRFYYRSKNMNNYSVNGLYVIEVKVNLDGKRKIKKCWADISI